MIIERLRLQNIKNYSDTELCFHPGVNFIKGKNGAGKSTIIESIGYALFNCYDGRGANEDFLTYGQSEGMIEVDFTAADGAGYTVVRKLSLKPNRRAWNIYERGSDTPLELFRDEEKQVFLADAMGLLKERDPAWIFRDIIGVRQGEFKAPFELPAEKRKEYFNRIFGVEDYTKAFDRLLEVVKELGKRGELIEKDIAYLAEEAKGLAEKTEEQASILSESEAAKKRMAVLHSEARQNGEALNLQKRLKEDRTRLEKDILSADELVKNLKVQDAEKKAQLENAKKAAEKVRLHEKGFLEYNALREQLSELEKKSAEKQAIQAEAAKVQASLSRLAGEIASEEKAMSERKKGIVAERAQIEKALAEIAKKAAGLEAEAGRAKALDTAIENLSKAAAKSYEYVDKGRAYVSGTLAVKAAERDGIKSAIRELGDRIARAEGLAGRERELEEEKLRLAELVKSRSVLEERQEALLRYSGYLKQGLCPFFEGECAAARREGQAGLEKEREDARRELQKTGEEIEKVQKRIEDLKAFEGLGMELQNMKKQLSERETALVKCGAELLELAKKPAAWDMAARAEALRGEYGALFGEAVPCGPLTDAFGAYREAADASSDGTAAKYVEAFQAFDTFLQAFREGVNARRVEELAKSAQVGNALSALKAEETARNSRKAELLAEEKKLDEAVSALGARKKQEQAQKEAFAAKNESLKSYEGLEDSIGELKKQVQRREEDHTEYLQNRPESEKTAALEAGIAAIAKQSSNAAERIASLNRDLKENAYDAKKEEELLAAATELGRRTGEEGTRLSHLAEDARRIAQEIEKKQAAEAKLTAARERRKRIAGAQEIVKNVRAAMKVAGPRIAGLFRSRIEARSDSIYRNVSKESVNLAWTDAYELELHDLYNGSERVRVFRQLSGGEKMTAALAVRLGLLETFSGAAIGFFDEPTDNMDIMRRENLADILLALCSGFSQAFVVSHDDTFDKITDNVVSLGTAEAKEV
jgi:exonuclease SbcC